jgi:predicted aconitase with swiveling domain
MSCTSYPVLYSTTSLSFWGGIDPSTGIIIDTSHPLVGQCVTNTALCIPSGRGSCTGSQVLLELILKGIAPRAIITRDRDAILCVGAIVSEEFFTVNPHDDQDTTYDENDDEVLVLSEGSVPIIVAVGAEEFANLNECTTLSINRSDNNTDPNDNDDGRVCIHYFVNDEQKLIVTKDLLRLKDTLLHHNHSTDNEETPTPTFSISLAEEKALRTIKRVASIHEATELIPVTSAHIDAVTYIGQGGLQFARRLVQLGGQVKVTTTMNAQSCDRRRWSTLGIDSALAKNANSVGDAYLDLGCELSFTCAPYLLPTRPKMGEDIVWGESNAVVFANSVSL